MKWIIINFRNNVIIWRAKWKRSLKEKNKENKMERYKRERILWNLSDNHE